MPDRAAHLNGCRLVIGASRGIGLALVRAQLNDDQAARVIATFRPQRGPGELEALADRHDHRLLILPLEVTDDSSIEMFARRIGSLEGGFDIAVHAAGFLHEGGIQPEKTLDHCDRHALRHLFEVNSIGPLMLARALLPLQSRQRRFTFAALSAMVGSIGDNRLGGWYGYRASKAALNQFLRTLANECRVRFPNAAILAVHPGTTDTGLSRPFQRNVPRERLYAPETTAARILDVIGQPGQGPTGAFLNWDGTEIPW
ncbi:MAG: SDR family oxidoreductase [Lysobacterales bacterium]|jgi:NAD(P)-dependent dehydrogenase (short-subunit alcohol dehydrogenase family)